MRKDGIGKAMEAMLRDIDSEVHYTRGMIQRAALSPRVMAAIAEVPRHEFVPDHLQGHAYANRPLQIGHGQTISQPYIVALMSDLLETSGAEVVLEIGTGCGYQAAVLSRLVKQVYSIEIIAALAEAAKRRLADLGFDNVQVENADGYHGLPGQAPFDGVILTAAPDRVPPALIDQLKPGGHLVAPVGSPMLGQQLIVLSKDADGLVSRNNIIPVAFVPLTRKQEH